MSWVLADSDSSLKSVTARVCTVLLFLFSHRTHSYASSTFNFPFINLHTSIPDEHEVNQVTHNRIREQKPSVIFLEAVLIHHVVALSVRVRTALIRHTRIYKSSSGRRNSNKPLAIPPPPSYHHYLLYALVLRSHAVMLVSLCSYLLSSTWR